MHPVSQAYLQSADAHLRNGTWSLDMHTVTIDRRSQSDMTVESEDAIGTAWQGIKRLTPVPPEIATLEPGRMRADGTARIVGDTDPEYFVSKYLSSEIESEYGDYELESAAIRFGNLSKTWETENGTVTVLFGEEVSRARLSFFDGAFVWEYTAAQDNMWVMNLAAVLETQPGTTRINFTLEILATKTPLTRARLYKLYCGRISFFDWSAVTELQYRSANDCIGFELPSHTVSVTMDNSAGLFDVEMEAAHPSFVRHYTQGFLTLQYTDAVAGVSERIPLGRLFLDEYTVDTKTLAMRFVSAIELMNEGTHWRSTTQTGTLQSKLEEVMDQTERALNQSIISTIWGSSGERDRTVPGIYGMTLNTDGAQRLTKTVSLPCPPVPYAQALQLYANLSGNVLCPSRYGGSDADLLFRAVQSNNPVRRITAEQVYEDAKTEAARLVSRIRMTLTCYDGATSTEKVDENVTFSALMNRKYTSDKYISAIEGLSAGTQVVNELLLATRYAFAAYVVLFSGTPAIADIRMATREKRETEVVISLPNAPPGVELPLNNPIVRANREDYEAYVQLLYEHSLRHNVTRTLQTRGNPELDCGDVVLYEDENDTLMYGRILENNFTIGEGGAMSGNIRFRRLGYDGS